MKFHDGQYRFSVPFIMYTDFEAILEPIEGSTLNLEMPYTEGISKHVTSGFCVDSEFTYGNTEDLLKFIEVKIA